MARVIRFPVERTRGPLAASGAFRPRVSSDSVADAVELIIARSVQGPGSPPDRADAVAKALAKAECYERFAAHEVGLAPEDLVDAAELLRRLAALVAAPGQTSEPDPAPADVAARPPRRVRPRSA